MNGRSLLDWRAERRQDSPMAKISKTPRAVRQMLHDARTMEQKGRREQAQALRAAAARIAARERQKAGDELPLDPPEG
jgi:hypothetical protein